MGNQVLDNKVRALCLSTILILGKAFQVSRIAWTKSIKVGNNMMCLENNSLSIVYKREEN